MQLRVSSPGNQLAEDDIDQIQKDLEKLDRRLSKFEDVYAWVRIQGKENLPVRSVVLEVEYGRKHLIAKAEAEDPLQAVREARDEILRQINDRSRGGHSSYAKRT
ncbi:MAG TPA: hypothetical protein VE975_00515 [Actinomycetota bacterium]|jgi:ribosome-associated translation inhibitor RaiA|nr:hypothetical protein [Actinomycetota bacterium]